MIKFKKINKEIGKKLTAFTLATTTSFTAISGVSAKEGDMCYNEQIVAEYKTIAGDYVVKKKSDNSIEIIESNSRNTNRLTLSNDGKVKIVTQNKKYLGLFTDTETTTFTVTNFNSQRLDIENLNTKNNDVKKVLDALEKYIEASPVNGKNYVEILGEDFLDNGVLCYNNYDIRDVVNTSKKQYKESAAMLYNDLSSANIIESDSLLVGIGELTGMVLSNPELAVKLAGTAKTIVGVGIVLLIFTMLHDEIVVAGENVISLADSFFDNTSDYTYDVGDVDVRSIDITNCVPISNAMDQIEANYGDNNPDNDYFQAILRNNDVYINVITPLSMEQAANLLKIPGWQSAFNNNIYTYQPEDARKVIEYAGGVVATSSGRKDFAECHAFDKSYEGFDKSLNMFNLNSLILSPNVKPGVYYWHYHYIPNNFNKKDKTPKKHVFFGIPIMITQNDINKYNINGRLNAGQIDNYETISNSYARSRNLRK